MVLQLLAGETVSPVVSVEFLISRVGPFKLCCHVLQVLIRPGSEKRTGSISQPYQAVGSAVVGVQVHLKGVDGL